MKKHIFGWTFTIVLLAFFGCSQAHNDHWYPSSSSPSTSEALEYLETLTTLVETRTESVQFDYEIVGYMIGDAQKDKATADSLADLCVKELSFISDIYRNDEPICTKDDRMPTNAEIEDRISNIEGVLQELRATSEKNKNLLADLIVIRSQIIEEIVHCLGIAAQLKQKIENIREKFERSRRDDALSDELTEAYVFLFKNLKTIKNRSDLWQISSSQNESDFVKHKTDEIVDVPVKETPVEEVSSDGTPEVENAGAKTTDDATKEVSKDAEAPKDETAETSEDVDAKTIAFIS